MRSLISKSIYGFISGLAYVTAASTTMNTEISTTTMTTATTPTTRTTPMHNTTIGSMMTSEAIKIDGTDFTLILYDFLYLSRKFYYN